MRSKILIVANSSWNLYNFRKPLLSWLHDEGFELVYVSMEDRYRSQLPPGRFYSLKHLDARGMHIWKDFRLFVELFRMYRMERPVLVLQFTIKPNFYGSLAARMLKIPCISHVTGLGMAISGRHTGSKILAWLYARALRRNMRVIFHNEEDRRFFTNKHLLDPDKTLVIDGSGVNTDYFLPKHTEANRKEFTFLFVGRLLIDKGIREYLEACRILFEGGLHARFWIAGSFDPQARNSISAQELNQWTALPGARYWGHLEDIREVFSESSVLVLPSYWEGMPRAALEAMSMEIPVICSDVPACRQLLQNGKTGLQCKAADIQSLVDAMKRMYQMAQDIRLDLGKQARQLVLQRYALPHILNAYDNLFKEIAKSAFENDRDASI